MCVGCGVWSRRRTEGRGPGRVAAAALGLSALLATSAMACTAAAQQRVTGAGVVALGARLAL